MPTTIRAGGLVLSLILVSSSGCSQGEKGTATLDERIELAQEYLNLSRMNQTDRIVESFVASLESSYSHFYQSLGEEIRFESDAQKELFFADAEDSRNAFLESTRDVYFERIDLAGIASESFVALIAERFSAEELRELNAFYRTPVGRKFAETMPEVTAEAMPAIIAEILPELQEVTATAMLEERERLIGMTD